MNSVGFGPISVWSGRFIPVRWVVLARFFKRGSLR